jgi:hypothetical protein
LVFTICSWFRFYVCLEWSSWKERQWWSVVHSRCASCRAFNGTVNQSTSETTVNFYQTTWCNNAKDSHLQPYEMFVKHSFPDKNVSVTVKKCERPVHIDKLKQKYSALLVNGKKIKDIQNLVCFIPASYHDLYLNWNAQIHVKMMAVMTI